MKKYLSLIMGILALGAVIYSFIGNAPTSKIIGMEVNIWVYRLFWCILAIGLLSGYWKMKNK
ncbi:hypothetical protein HPE56_09270 [Maribacter sp. ANRC-HE7]|uniref:Uncharacterized protein n=1 Tax=Maribacter aquimaris TaxID=2737171 RepID=A0ABR7UZL1_9FLAO|nr:hypothetical protein [Maribacter aquimaris]MBD0777983.1 hypothetical protein [Maribacter aquimaris]